MKESFIGTPSSKYTFSVTLPVPPVPVPPVPVPVDGTFTAWSEWSTCSGTCGTGKQTSIRKYIPAINGGKDAADKDVLSKEQDCDTKIKCKVLKIKAAAIGTPGNLTITYNIGTVVVVPPIVLSTTEREYEVKLPSTATDVAISFTTFIKISSITLDGTDIRHTLVKPPTAYYLRIRAPDKRIMNIMDVEVYKDNGKGNYAYSRDVKASSVHSDTAWNKLPSLTDGIWTTGLQSSGNEIPFFRIDISEPIDDKDADKGFRPIPVKQIVIINRPGTDRTDGCIVELLSKDEAVVWSHTLQAKGASRYTLNCISYIVNTCEDAMMVPLKETDRNPESKECMIL